MARLLLCLLLFLLLVSSAGAYTLTEADYQKLQNDIVFTNQAEFAAAVAAQDYAAITDAYNLAAAPDFWVWKSRVTEQEIYESTSVAGTTWNWATFKAQAVQERDAWTNMMHAGVINPSLAQTRAAFNVIFGGQGASAAQQQFLLDLSRRKTLRGEKLFAGVPGTGTAADPATLTFEGQLRARDIYHALTGGPL